VNTLCEMDVIAKRDFSDAHQAAHEKTVQITPLTLGKPFLSSISRSLSLPLSLSLSLSLSLFLSLYILFLI
jgi:long-subunit fatty acid transport protein